MVRELISDQGFCKAARRIQTFGLNTQYKILAEKFCGLKYDSCPLTTESVILIADGI